MVAEVYSLIIHVFHSGITKKYEERIHLLSVNFIYLNSVSPSDPHSYRVSQEIVNNFISNMLYMAYVDNNDWNFVFQIDTD